MKIIKKAVATGGGATKPYTEHTFDGGGNLIAAKLYGYTTIPYKMFYQQTTLASVDLTECPNLTSISNYAFYGCTALTSIDLSGVITIKDYALNGCTSLTSVDAPDAVTIGYHAFFGCTAITTVNIPNAATINEAAFRGCTSLTTINAPSVATIGIDAFTLCTNAGFTAVTLGSVGHPVTSIASSGFYGDTQILSITVYTTGGASLANQPWGATAATITYLSA